MKKTLCLIFVLSIMSFCFSGLVIASDFVDPNIPESWYKPLKTASEAGITEFKESPMLSKKVASGELPPVEERLPEDPPVIEPYDKVGEYGGTLIVWGTDLNYWTDAMYIDMPAVAGQPTPGGGDIIPLYIKDWEYSDNATKLTLYLRKGIKWSDGEEMTADDYIFWWDHVAHNELLNATPPEKWTPIPLLDLSKKDDYTVVLTYGKPNPLQHRFSFQHSMGLGSWRGLIQAEHFMRKFHTDFVSEDEINKMIEDEGLDNWSQLYNRYRFDSPTHPEYKYDAPDIRPYVAVKRTQTELVLERNPYFPFVDTEGNQLPYIDRVRINLANNNEMAATKAATGEADISGRYTTVMDLPLYKKNEEKEGYKTLLYNKAVGAEINVNLNLTHKDPKIRSIFHDVRFRKALSLAIDREDINEKVFFGQAVPRQTTVMPTNPVFKQEYADAYADYKPEEARAYLDEMGMVDVNGDGYRETPDGEEFNPTFLYCQDMGPVDPTRVLELIAKKWKDIGINLQLKMVSRELRQNRIESNDFDISCWAADSMLLSFGSDHLGKYFAPIGQPHYSSWPEWVSWYESGGDQGMEPPQKVKQLIEWAEQMSTSADKEVRTKAAENLVKSQAENLWCIGTVGLSPQPIMVSNRLKNVPNEGLWDWSIRYMRPMYPCQFYLEE